MTSHKTVYAHKTVNLVSDDVQINGVSYPIPVIPPTPPYVPIPPSYSWVQLKSIRNVIEDTGFAANSSIESNATIIPEGQWVEIGLNAADGYLKDEGLADFAAQKITSDISFNAQTGRLTFQTPGDYIITYNILVSRVSGIASKTYSFYAAIGGNGNEPNESFGGGGSASINVPVNCAGMCIDTIVNPGDTRSLWLYHNDVDGGSSIHYQVHGLNWIYHKMK
jgi:hypothetical protein